VLDSWNHEELGRERFCWKKGEVKYIQKKKALTPHPTGERIW
jgi:hypothetical protein